MPVYVDFTDSAVSWYLNRQMCRFDTALFAFALTLFPAPSAFPQPPKPFIIHVVDDQTGRGVPLVELQTLNEASFFTDSAGIAAIADPVLFGHNVFFRVRSHGYEFLQKFFDETGARLAVASGGHAELKIHRMNIAERLYRITGAGIYQDSVMAGLPVPISQPLLNGGVIGQDTVSTAIYRGRIFWIWGDTLGLANYNFAVSGATSELPGRGGLDPSVGIDLHYFTRADGFSRALLPLPRQGLVWIQGLFTTHDPSGRERLLATYTRQQGLVPPDECGIALYNDEKEVFEPWSQRSCLGGHSSSHPLLHTVAGHAYWYLYPLQRVPDDWNAFQDPKQWESFNSETGAWQKGEVKIDNRDRRSFPLIDVATGKPSGASASCVVWNQFLKRWILLSERFGDVFYAEARQPEGPWTIAILIVHHDHYNFYNVATHPFLNQEDGRVIYLEGTYTTSFTDAKVPTPRYNYNQLMYRLRLDDPRLEAVRPQDTPAHQ
jgi:hypothetical protein